MHPSFRRKLVSAIPSAEIGPLVRSIALKRLGRLRMHWFLVGTLFGVSLSVLTNAMFFTAAAPSVETAAAEKPAAEVAAATAPPAVAKPVHPPAKGLRPIPRQEKVGDTLKELAITLPDDAPDRTKLKQAALSETAAKMQAKGSIYRGYGVIRSSLFQAGSDAGIPKAAMQEIVRAFSYDIDFQRDIHPGDTIEVLIDRGQGKAAKGKAVAKPKSGETVRYAALTLKGRKHEIYRYNNAWYDDKGKSIKKSLLTTPMMTARISSGFGMREHPVLGYNKFHRGVDFSASTGTPILAAGDGVVKFKGWKNGYGNFVVIQHNGTYETAYGHISRFAKIQVGSKVKQGQVIAYVGSTGLATGPHLHYEVRMNDRQVNPTARQFNIASGLGGKELTQFKLAKAESQRKLAALAKSIRVASR